MRALRIDRKLTRFAAARVASAFGAGRGAVLGPLRLVDVTAPSLPSADWFPVTPIRSGICGSDLASVDGRSSLYFEDIVSFPFILQMASHSSPDNESWCNPCWAVLPEASSYAPPVGLAMSDDAAASPTATSLLAYRPASAATPEGDGQRVRWWLTQASSSLCPTT